MVMLDLFIFFWGAIITTGWWLLGTVIVFTPIIEEWVKILFAGFVFLNLATLGFILQVLIKSIDKAWIIDE